MSYFTLNDGTPLFYVDEGAGRPLVLLQGLQFSSRYFWQRNIAELARTHRVIAIDTRGQGLSGKPIGGYTIAQAAADLEELLAGLELKAACLAGVAFGGLVALSYYERYGPARLRSLVLCEMTPRLLSEEGWAHPTFGDFPPQAGYAYAADVRADRSVLDGFLQAAFATPPDPDTLAEMRAEMYLTPTSVIADLIDDMVRQDFRAMLPSIAVPALLIYGRGQNPVMPGEIGRWMQAQIPKAELVELGTGHSPFWENPSGFNAALSRFAAAH